ncbi:MAG: transporter substrate-binding domain-containing protein [Halopseudomonas sp.]
MWLRLLLIGLLCIPNGLQAKTLQLGGIVRCPYVCAADDPYPGFMLEIAQKVFDQAGHKVQFELLPWGRALRYVRRGSLDGVVGVSRRNAPDLLYPQRAQAIARYAFFVPSTSAWQYSGLVSLWQVRVGVTQDISYGSMDSYIRRYRDGVQIQSLAGETAASQNLHALSRGRIDVLLEDRAVMDYLAHKNPASVKLTQAGSLHAERLFIAFSAVLPESEDYAATLSDGLGRLRSSGELAAILARYGLSDWESK